MSEDWMLWGLFILLGLVIAVSVHLLGIADVPGLVRSRVIPE